MNQPRTTVWRQLSTWVITAAVLCSFVCTLCGAAQSGGPSNGLDNKPNEETGVWYTSVCENQVMDLRCPGGGVILIESANFGRTDDQTCLGHGSVENTGCRLPTTFEVVTTMCDYHKVCSIRASSSIFGDPCPGTFKFLAVDYECISPPQTTTRPPLTTPTPANTVGATPSMNSTMAVDTVPTSSAHPPTTTPPVEPTSRKKDVSTEHSPPNVCPAVSRRGISWPVTNAGFIADTHCPEGAKGYARWTCVHETGQPAAWDVSGPDLSNCQSEWVSNLTQLVDQGANTTVVSTAIVDKIDTNEMVYSSDIQDVTNFMSQSIDTFEESLQDLEEEEKFEETHKVSQNYLEITSVFLDNNNVDSWREMDTVVQSESAANILASVEETALLWADTIELTEAKELMMVTLEESNVVMSIMVQDSSHGNPVDAVFPSEHSVSSSMWTGIEDQVIIPKENFEGSEIGKAKAVFVAYNNIHEYLGIYPPKTKQTKKKAEEPFVNSRIMSASLATADHRTELREPVEITLAHISVDNATSPTCSFWDFEKSSTGDWSSEGCKVTKTNSTHTVCSCNHLTNFAILMNYKAVEVTAPHDFALSVITYFGFIISCVCLLLAFITFCMFKNLQNDRNTIHKNLCLTLLIAEVIFMAGISQTQIEILCSVIAMLLHYFFLSAFAWMCLEGIQLYVMLVEVFEAESSRRKYYYPFGYGLPAVVIAVSAALNFDGYGTEAYCWLSAEDYFIWAFIAPICLIIVVNTIFLTMAMYIMCRHSKLQTNPKERNTSDKIAGGDILIPGRSCDYCTCGHAYDLTPDNPDMNAHVMFEDHIYETPSDKLIVGSTRMEYIASWLRGAIVLLCLLGITWVFGLAYVNANMVVFAYIFTAFNALQGMFIYVFHCLMNDKVRIEYRRYIRNSTWLPACIRDNYGGIFTSNSNQQQSFRSSSSGRGRGHDSKRLSNTTGSYSIDHRRISSSSACRCSGEYMPIQSPPPLDEEQIGSYVYEEVPECGFLPTHIVEEAERALRADALRREASLRGRDEGIGLELEGHPTWSQKPSVVVANADGDLAMFTKNDRKAPAGDLDPLITEPGLGNNNIDQSQLTTPGSEGLTTISYHVQRSDPDLPSLTALKPLLKGVVDDEMRGRRESGIGASQSEGDQSSASSDQMYPHSPVTTPEAPSKAYIFPNAHNSTTSMPDLVHSGKRAQPVGEGSKRPSLFPLAKKSNSSVGVGEPRRQYNNPRQRPDHSVSMETELYVPRTLSRIETTI